MELLKHINTELYFINSYPKTLNIKAEVENIMFEGSPVHSYITVEALNEHNERIVSSLTIYINTRGSYGSKNCTFENGKMSIDVITSSVDIIKIPIIITDAGGIDFMTSINMIEEAS